MQWFLRGESVASSCSKHLVALQEFQISTPWINSHANFTPEEVVFHLTITSKTIFFLIFLDLLKFSLCINIKTFEKGKKIVAWSWPALLWAFSAHYDN